MKKIKIQKGKLSKEVSEDRVSHFTDRGWEVEKAATKQPAASKTFKMDLDDEEEKVELNDVIKGD